MYMRIARARIDPPRFDEVRDNLEHDLIAAFKRQPGFQSVMSSGDRASGQWIVVSTWDTEEHARFSRDALGDIVPRNQALGVQTDPPEAFEVFAQT
jgi:quinol monooxygenase YgiN